MAKVIDFSTIKDNAYNIVINENDNASLILVNIDRDIELNFSLNKYSNCQISVLNDKENLTINVLGKIDSNAFLEVYFADFARGNCIVTGNIDLVGEYAKCVWHLGALSSNKDKKVFDVSIDHKSPLTESKIDNYGVCKNDSKLVFSGTCTVENGSHKSKAHQNAKIMVFDPNSDAIAKPILKIDDNDIEASHAASVGRISDDELFYLTSRGLSLKQARELITYGYLKPILKGFDNDEIRDHVASLIEGGF